MALKKSRVVKRSITVGRRVTSVSLEDDFWEALKEIANQNKTSLGKLVAAIEAKPYGSNLSSAIRVFVLGHYQDQISTRKR